MIWLLIIIYICCTIYKYDILYIWYADFIYIWYDILHVYIYIYEMIYYLYIWYDYDPMDIPSEQECCVSIPLRVLHNFGSFGRLRPPRAIRTNAGTTFASWSLAKLVGPQLEVYLNFMTGKFLARICDKHVRVLRFYRDLQ